MEPNRNRSNLVLGALLVAFGILLFLNQVTGFGRSGEFWPFIIIGVGVAFYAGMALGGKQTGALAIPASIITMVGLILFVQNLTGWWETWAYAWALIIAAVGAGMVIHGYWSDLPEQRSQGHQTIRTGLILFLIFGTIMEFIFSITGVTDRGGNLLWPVLLTVAGLYLLVTRMYRLLSGGSEACAGDKCDLFWPVLLTGVGAMATLAALNLLPALQWNSLLSLWPVLLIAAGLQIIFGRRSAWVSGVLGLLVLAGIIAIGLFSEQLGLRTNTAWYLIPGVNVGGSSWIGGERVEGSGQAEEQLRAVSGFDEVVIALPADVEIVQGGSEELALTADDNLLEYITTEVRGGQLIIGTKRGYNLSIRTTLKVQLTVKELSKLVLSSAGKVDIRDLQTEDLELVASGVGDVNMVGLQAESLDAAISGMGSINADGQVERVNLGISGAGDFRGQDLQCSDAEVQISGAGQATLRVSDELDVSISGAGSVSYYGSPDVTKSISGAGSVRKLGD